MIRTESAKDQVNVAKVYEANQEQIFEYWDELSPEERKVLLAQLESIDFKELDRLLQHHLQGTEEGPATSLGDLKPAPLIGLETSEAVREEAREIGNEALKAGQVALFLVAGGQGTRLKFEGPKGMFPIGPITDRTLFQHFADKVSNLRRRLKTSLTWMIMTSEVNHEETVAFFETNRHFGLNAADVFFAKQGMLPSVDPRRGRILLSAKNQIALSPNGHGGAIAVMQSFAEQLRRRNIRYIFTFQVDNPLVRMADPEFIGHHIRSGSDFSSKATPKSSPDEKVGVFCMSGSEMRVVEYTELADEQRHARDDDGKISFRAGNIAQHVVSVDFILPKDDEPPFEMPYHMARKAIPFIKDGEPVSADTPNSARFESFIFDVMGKAPQPIVMEVARSEEFAPVKNLDGQDSPATARQAMSAQWAGWIESAGHPLSSAEDSGTPDASGATPIRIEISPLVADSAQELADYLSNHSDSLDVVENGDLLIQA